MGTGQKTITFTLVLWCLLTGRLLHSSMIFHKDKDSVYVLYDTRYFKSVMTNTGNIESINIYYIKAGNTIYYPPFGKIQMP